MNNLENKKLPVWLIIGIILVPLIFAWFTLKKGYSKTTKILSFGWLLLVIVVFVTVPQSAMEKRAFENVTAKQEVQPHPQVTEKPSNAVSADKKENNEDKTPPFELTNDPKQNVANAQAHYEKLADEDRPHFEWPRVDYTKAVTKVNLHNDQAIIKAVGKPVADKETATNENGEPMTSYWFDKQPASGLQIDLSREFIDVAWFFNDKEQDKATAIFMDGQRITRALLGGKVGSDVYENMAKGLKFKEIVTIDGIELKDVRCGANVCRYQVVR